MFQKSGKNFMKRKRYNKKMFIFPLIVWTIGFIISFIAYKPSSPKSVYSIPSFSGYIMLGLGTGLFFHALVKEKYRLKLKIRFPLKILFPAYPIVEDYNQLTRNMSSFKEVYSEFMNNIGGSKINSKIQDYATQMLWHCIYLQKKRMEKLGIQIGLESSRLSYSKKSDPVRSTLYFDGRYNVNDVYEEIYSVKTFRHENRNIKKVYNKEVAHYTFLSAKNVGKDEVVCPNCGSLSSRSNLIDGCDFCGTKFTIEDLDNRVASFGFRRDFEVMEGKREAIKKVIFPWFFFAGGMPFAYIGFLIPFISVKNMEISLPFAIIFFYLQVIMGLLAAVVFSVLGFVFVTISMWFIVPVVMLFNQFFKFLNSKLVYRSKGKLYSENRMAQKVRKKDPLFSIQSFFGGVQNKLYAIHFADKRNQVNAFSDLDLSEYLKKYEKVVDIETLSLSMDLYRVKKGIQIATVRAELLLREFKDNKIKNRKEFLKLQLEKSEYCKTQAVCAPSILKCTKCGGNLSLLEGKICKFCGNELDMKEHDWVITEYSSMQEQK
ncbi:hypothetical protein [Leptotrichia buccalis]|uniref:Tim44-like domain-containing protein n=1 Tax=Leptotrichia buccalis (strain ATCC 14201 / DSM 1135 / JCM 12969 / NCTC 10249 / C-1013-b) TaxID=523794 RepID=C7N9C1_LEPBD|nr:hypothetical protein [Leptotrichia buccalis]ACV38752.1 hypothetical protein Lebu_0844 [Leptotrichia buccalis C-1013-b]